MSALIRRGSGTLRCELVWYFLCGKCAYRAFVFSLVRIAEPITAFITVFNRGQRNFGVPTGTGASYQTPTTPAASR